jgi:putative acetyltransferase
MQTVVRTEEPGDEAGIRLVERAAFGRDAEADLVDAVRETGAALLSLVAADGGEIVGHVLFTPVAVGRGAAVGLGPLAVLPRHQGRGIGTALVREGLTKLRAAGHGAVIVVGEPRYYRRFGFVPASRYGVRWDRPVADEVFMALELRALALRDGGLVRYHPAFDAV